MRADMHAQRVVCHCHCQDLQGSANLQQANMHRLQQPSATGKIAKYLQYRECDIGLFAEAACT
jgi:hypothetical protein